MPCASVGALSCRAYRRRTFWGEFVAELGSMRQTEQIDAIELLGRSPIRELAAPRVWGCILTLPVLYFVILYLALGSGYLAEALGGGITLTCVRD